MAPTKEIHVDQLTVDTSFFQWTNTVGWVAGRSTSLNHLPVSPRFSFRTRGARKPTENWLILIPLENGGDCGDVKAY